MKFLEKLILWPVKKLKYIIDNLVRVHYQEKYRKEAEKHLIQAAKDMELIEETTNPVIDFYRKKAQK